MTIPDEYQGEISGLTTFNRFLNREYQNFGKSILLNPKKITSTMSITSAATLNARPSPTPEWSTMMVMLYLSLPGSQN
nr:hypothetical protein [Piscirickettsia salmonis]